MMGKRARRFRGRPLILLALLAGGRVAAQTLGILVPGSWDGSVQATYSLSRDSVSTDGIAEPPLTQRSTSQQFTIRNNGFYVLAPELLTGSLGLTLGLDQQKASSGESVESVKSKLLGYSFDAGILNDLPYGGSLFANRSRSTTLQPFGRVETLTTTRGATLRLNEGSPLKDLGFPYLSATLRLEHQHLQQLSSSALGLGSSRQDELRDTLSHIGHKGYETADLDWQFEFNNIKDRVAKNGSYRGKSASLSYSGDFGPTLNRRWDSRINYMSRVGSSSLSLLSVNEHLHIAHQSNLSTDYAYQLSRLETALSGPSLSQSGSMTAQYQPYQNLGGFALVKRQLLPSGRIDNLAGGFKYRYEHSLPWQGKLVLGADGSYQLTDTHMVGTQVNVTDETQAAPAALGAGAGFLLNQAFAVTASILVVDTRNGARLPTELGVDYELVQEGNLTRIVPLLTSSVILAGDPLAVSYTYAIAPSLKYGTASKALRATMNFGWISLSAAHNESKVNLLGGEDSRFLQSFRNDSAQVDLHGTWKTLQGGLGSAYLRSRATQLSYTERRYYQSATYKVAPNLGLSVNSDWTLTNYQLPSRRSDARATNLTANWADGGLSVNAHAGLRYLKSNLQPTETVSEAGLRAQLKYGQLLLTSAFSLTQRIRGGSELNNWQLSFVAVRNL